MITAPRPLLLLATVAAISTGCGGASDNVSTATVAAGATSTAERTSVATLKAAVRTAVQQNVQLSTYVLWHNSIPAWATQSTRGPALKALRNAAATRRKQGIQIKNLSGHYTITSLALATSYTAASVVIESHQRVAPYKAGRRLGRAIVGTDHARVQLRRVGITQRFIVWSVSPIQ